LLAGVFDVDVVDTCIECVIAIGYNVDGVIRSFLNGQVGNGYI